ncbi:MAG: PAS domain-containing protein [Dehalococcoidia bacterium]|nr:PAS domain-containing protein [Dehalococcoidia bacterium]
MGADETAPADSIEDVPQAVLDAVRAALEGIPTPIVLVDRDLNVLLVNPTWRELTADPRYRERPITYRELVGRYVASESADALTEALRDAITGGRARTTTEVAVDARRPHAIRLDVSRIEVGSTSVFATAYLDLSPARQQRELLERDRERLERAQEISRTGDIEIHLATREAWASPELRRLFDLDPDDALDMETMQTRVHPEDRDRLAVFWLDPHRAAAAGETTYRVMARDGTLRYVRGRAQIRTSATGEEYVTAYAQDVTESMQAEEELRVSEVRLQTAERIARLGSWEWDPAAESVTWSDETYRIYGQKRSEFAPHPRLYNSLIHPDDRERVARDTRALLKGERLLDLRQRIIRPDGSVRVIQRNADWVERGGRRIIIGTTQDVTETVAAEERLRSSEARLREAESMAQLGHWDWNLDTNEIVWSDQMYRTMGLEPSEGVPDLRRYLLDIVHPDDRNGVSDAGLQAMREAGGYDLRYRILRPDGEVRVIHEVTRVIERSETGRAHRMLGVLRDTTDEVAAERRLRSSESRLREAEAIARLGHWEWNVDGDQLYWSDENYHLHGRSPDNPIGSAEEFLRYIHPDDLPHMRAEMVAALRGERDMDSTLRIVREDGAIRTVRGVARVVERSRGRAIRMVGTVYDITDLEEAHERLRRNEARLREAEAIAHLGSWEWDLTSGHQVWSDEVWRIYGSEPQGGLTPQQVLDRYVPAEDIEAMSDLIRRLFRGEPVEPLVHRVVRPGGEVRYVTFHPRVAERDGDRVLRIIGASQDITEQRATDERLRQMQKSEALGTLVAGVAHDFNNLLTAIRGGLEMAREYPGEQRWLDIAQQASDRAAEVVRQLLRFSRREEPQQVPMDAAELVREATMLSRETLDRRVSFTSFAEGEFPPLAGDPGQMQQVLMNLIVNARDAVLQRAEEEPVGYQPALQLTARPATQGGRPGVAFEVRDNGTGMSEEVRQRALDPFFTTKPADRGTGLGLAAVAGIVQRHEGLLTITTTPGEGTEVAVWLPARRPESSLTSEDIRRTGATGPGAAEAEAPTIFVVDDEEALGAIAAAYLEAAGLHVAYFGDGNAAVEAARAIPGAPPALVLLDLNMPPPDGWETMAALREVDPDLPVVIVSGFADEDEVHQRGAQAFLAKPYSRADLLEMVRLHARTDGTRESG